MPRLESGERGILSYFPNSAAAQEAAEELRRAGFQDIQIDRVSRYGVESDAHLNNPINNATSLAGLTVYSKGTAEALGDSGRVLLAADPSASGYGGRGYGTAGGRAYLLALVVPEERVDEAVEIIKKNGGVV
ncbi:MAG: hypothetical protein ACPLTR_10765 [Thermacetogeniaceae bacterium]